MPPLSKAASILDLDPESYSFTCVGHARTQGRRCRNRIAAANSSRAADLLSDLKITTISPHRLDEKLHKLASLVLCRRWHQNQASKMVEEWREIIEEYREARRAEREREARRARRAEREQERSDRMERRSRRSSPPERSITTTDPQRSSSESSSTTASSPILPPSSPTNSSTIPSTSPPPPALHISTSASTPLVPADDPTTPPPPYSTLPPTSISTSPVSTSSDEEEGRRPLEGDCSICTETFLSNEDDDARNFGTKWCKAQCGQNFHAQCVDTWLGMASPGHEGGRRCPYCRADWID